MLEVGKFAFDTTNSANVHVLEKIKAWGYPRKHHKKGT